MEPKEFTERMKQIKEGGDIEIRHSDADNLMCEVLADLGYEEGVKIFEEMSKWYA